MTDMQTTPTETSTRKLATVETITEIAPIPDADAIVRARIRGWDVVVKLNEFAVGDRCVYFEVDSMLDVTDPRFAFLEPRGVRTDSEGRKGHVLRTARLRGQYSQGLALPLAAFPELAADTDPGTDVTATLGIIKWDPPIPASLAGQVRGLRPSWIPKTDEERIQNLPEILTVTGDVRWEATEKVDGSSTSFWVAGDDEGVCSRNLDLIESDKNTLWRLARQLDIHAKIREAGLGARVVVQGEAYGEGIQKNPLRIKGQRFAAFALHVDGVEVPRGDWPAWLAELSVPTHDLTFPTSVDDALAQVEKLTSNIAEGRPAEGVVWRAADRSHVTTADGTTLRASFKAISNRYLMKHSD